MKRQIAFMFACAALNVSTVHAGPFDPPDPKTFARAEDRERARLLTKPCTEADIGRGCYRFDGRALRKAPCAYHISVNVTGSLPTDQCYKMQKPRRYTGVWVDEFEGQAFIPEGSMPIEWLRGDPLSSGWKARSEQARLARIWLDTSRVSIDRKRGYSRTGRLIEFVGRKTMYSGAYGHMGMSGHEIIVDHVISLRECPDAGSCG